MRAKKQKIHFESANFGNSEVYHFVLKQLTSSFDSIGLNEQELMNFVHFFSDHEYKVSWGSEVHLETILALITQLLQLIEQKTVALSRFHVHTQHL